MPKMAGMTSGTPICSAPKVDSASFWFSGMKSWSPAFDTPPPRIMDSGRKMVMNVDNPEASLEI